MNSFYREFGDRVREARKGRFTQTEFARRVGLSRASIANIEVGRQRVPLHMLSVFARELGVDPCALIPSGRLDEEGAVPEDRLERLSPQDQAVLLRVVRRARAERGEHDDKT